ncbi:D-alanyl-D-alanine carboxypeptidase / D-alanyl-D-alanine-endopeptidase (penicillin-binding protein 4) [Lentzea xinjiangensis]|uniref:D-alanyl-D-alanine carboxypeptidase / D-alanyl-D-alanine-endopeptidase (Penicillin-binding protein 4) n=1 Tax=Lentzea xinjiangensis TaxID=402600 RepID=A0A1H9GIK7_9PSEU|nr:D-alanyl-D-alanine carboxypeptidase/D-alanyl-D-alanine-endopeptidase [Lentzea xinjiangensis]SEQ49869.1 D-alanyl-D-alanine carboxypeptidase / D-alanyl-D-alanine-endopeptidase (penicillin-binding protein 4) [Lentzea xinjiangensis]
MKLRILGVVVAATAGLTLTSSGGAVAGDNEALTRDLDTILADPALTGADVGLVVRDANTGDVVYSRTSSRRQQVASNLKLLTTAAALDLLGPDFRWKTELLSSGARSGSTLQGDLVLRGSGDPTMSRSRYAALAAALKNSGVTKVSGSLVLDGTAFDAQPYGSGWAWDDEPYSYSAETSALTLSPDAKFSAGTVLVRVKPGAAAGAPVVATVEPANDVVHVVSTATTGSGGVSVERDHGTNIIRVSGSTNTETVALSTVKDPTSVVSSVFRNALRENGIEFTGDVRRSAAPSGATVVASDQSQSLGQLITPLMKDSNNMLAEVLVKSAGRSFTNGVNQLSTKWAGLGVDPNAVEVFDGSGMSRLDQFSPDALASILIKAKTKPWFATWQASLPVAGVDGTLVNRMRNTPAANNVKAKTGSLSGVSALSGYVRTQAGRDLVFSLVQNNVLLFNSPKTIEDRVAVRLASDGGAQVAAPQVQTVPQQRKAPAQERAKVPAQERFDVECSWIGTC